jgi:hypothetical protein
MCRAEEDAEEEMERCSAMAECVVGAAEALLGCSSMPSCSSREKEDS